MEFIILDVKRALGHIEEAQQTDRRLSWKSLKIMRLQKKKAIQQFLFWKYTPLAMTNAISTVTYSLPVKGLDTLSNAVDTEDFKYMSRIYVIMQQRKDDK